MPLPNNIWTESRKDLELVIQAEKAKDHADWNPDLNSQEERLRKRLAKLKLEMKVMVGDGNCLVSLTALSLVTITFVTEGYNAPRHCCLFHKQCQHVVMCFMDGYCSFVCQVTLAAEAKKKLID